MKRELKWLVTIAFALVLLNAYLTLSEAFSNESENENKVGYFKTTDYGSESSENLNIANAKNAKTITNGKKNIEKSQALLKKVKRVL